MRSLWSSANRASVVLALLLGASSRATSAQALRGKVVQPSDGTGIAGVLVLLIDSAGNVAARALTNEQGEYRVRVPGTGAYRVRTLRIGYHPSNLVAVELSARAALEQQLELNSLPLSLDTVRVAARARCSPYEGSSIIASAWEQARAALIAADLTSRNRVLHATVTRVQRALHPSGRVQQESSSQSSGFVTKPWGTAPPDSLRRFGYVYRLADGSSTYYAPDIDVLLSESFLQDHCFRFASGADSTQLGVAFEPAHERKNLPEIAGTVWLDRRSAALRRMEFRYVNLKRTRDAATTRGPAPGGTMDFGSMMNGSWAISRWELRIPVYRERYLATRSPYEEPTEAYITKVHVEVGVLTLVTRGRDTLWRAQ